MNTAPHPSEEQLSRFQHRTLEAGELLDVDQHLATCGECRERLWRDSGAPGQVASLRSVFSEHLEYEQIVSAADGSADAGMEQHLAECAMCQGEVDDLRQFQGELKAAPRTVVQMPARKASWRIPAYAAIAAGVVLAGGLTFRSLNQRPAVETPQIARVNPAPTLAPTQAMEPGLAPDQQAAVQLAVSTRRLERAEVLDRLIAKRGVLLGAPGEAKSFAVSAPLGTTVLTDRPVFRWEAVAGAGKYVVAVFDDRFQKVEESPSLSVTEWTPDQPLGRGRIYNWQVTAQMGGRTLRSPVPPAPEARFQVAGPEVAMQMDNARRNHPGNHLLLAVLLAKAGALDEASLELDRLAGTDAAMARALRESLNEIRKP